MNQEPKRSEQLPKKLLVKKRYFFDSQDISYPIQKEEKINSELLLQKDNKNDNTSDNIN